MKRSLLAILILFFISGNLKAQAILIGGHASYLTGAPDKANQWGGGIIVKTKIKNRIAHGGIIRSYLKNFKQFSEGTTSVKQADNLTQLSYSGEVYFGKNIQPYLGLDAGVYFTSHLVQGSGSGGPINISEEKAYIGLTPKAGIQFGQKMVIPFLQIQYNYLLGGGDQVPIPNTTTIESETMGNFLTIDFGILFKVGK
jgi:hypothetical protein